MLMDETQIANRGKGCKQVDICTIDQLSLDFGIVVSGDGVTYQKHIWEGLIYVCGRTSQVHSISSGRERYS